MEYITSFERLATEKGMQQGLTQGIQQGESIMLLCLIESKFKNIPEDARQKIQTADADTLLKWAKQILNSQSLEEVFKD